MARCKAIEIALKYLNERDPKFSITDQLTTEEASDRKFKSFFDNAKIDDEEEYQGYLNSKGEYDGHGITIC